MSAAETKPSAQDLLRTFTSPGPKVQLQLDINGLYIILSTQSANNVWHWVLYLHISESLGWVFHITDLGLVSWEYHCYECSDMVYSATAISVVKVADMAPEMHEALHARIGFDSRPAVRLEDTEHFGRLNCRTWLLQVLYELDNEGYISVRPGYSIRDVEQEALALASNNKYLMQEKRARLSELRKEMDSAYCAL
ncbi:hypothetical protein NLG97_g820 [Lecanicillium saksenae]|uniref:Uncharacterized protein n=1 Tax=Lecanicillium saksenae TaxID=468837 RepID=A0ACC1R5N6_9HYPO|nr:hypothetical protein NLG97_g820 [Lecanicillium saksenae]